jgi:hypothetical protein
LINGRLIEDYAGLIRQSRPSALAALPLKNFKKNPHRLPKTA